VALGIHWAHDASAAICTPDGILCAITEDRLNRLKHYYGFPCQAIRQVLAATGLTARDIDIFAVSTSSVLYPAHPNRFVVDLDGTRSSAAGTGVLGAARRWVRDNLGSLEAKKQRRMEEIRGRWGDFAPRHWVFQEPFLAELGLLDERIAHYYVHHHRAHAASAFRLSGLETACAISMDGKGDGISAATYRGHADGRLELVRQSDKADSLGSFYQAVTEALGFIPADGEYKTMGLAALGGPGAGPNPFAGTVSVEDGVLRSRVKWEFRDYNLHNPERRVPNPLSSVSHCVEYRKLLEAGMPREQLAWFAQEHFQENMVAYARDALRATGCRSLVAAGGVLLNVKANALIRDELRPARTFVFPDAADSGLSVGAAMEALYQAGAMRGPVPLGTPYVGHAFDDEEIWRRLAPHVDALRLRAVEATHEMLARELAAGKVLGTFQGRLELGPRALGNRSVLADARDAAVKDRINSLLKGREWFVPFAPILLEEDAGLYWDGPTDYRHMTFAVTASAYARSAVPAVVHVDGTMRPQVVRREDNSWAFDLLREFKRLTGVGLLVNTSFNRHGLPMVGSPDDALEHLLNGWVDAVALGRWYVERAS
jgi:carbamoyltransferase